MYKNKTVLAVVPARGGSKGIPLKNLRKVGGISLVGRAGKVLSQSKLIDKTVVSSDNSEIIAEAVKHELSAPFIRPEHLSGDLVSDFQVLEHSLVETERIYQTQFDIILMAQPTSPGRTVAIVDEAIKKIVDEELDSVWTVTKTEKTYHPLKQLVISDNGYMIYFDERGKTIIARQQLFPVYHRNGLIYAFSRDCLLKQRSIMGKKTGALISSIKVPNIDTFDDIKFAEYYLNDK